MTVQMTVQITEKPSKRYRYDVVAADRRQVSHFSPNPAAYYNAAADAANNLWGEGNWKEVARLTGNVPGDGIFDVTLNDGSIVKVGVYRFELDSRGEDVVKEIEGASQIVPIPPSTVAI